MMPSFQPEIDQQYSYVRGCVQSVQNPHYLLPERQLPGNETKFALSVTEQPQNNPPPAGQPANNYEPLRRHEESETQYEQVQAGTEI